MRRQAGCGRWRHWDVFHAVAFQGSANVGSANVVAVWKKCENDAQARAQFDYRGQASQPAWIDAEAGDGGNQKTMLGSGIGRPPPTPD